MQASHLKDKQLLFICFFSVQVSESMVAEDKNFCIAQVLHDAGGQSNSSFDVTL